MQEVEEIVKAGFESHSSAPILPVPDTKYFHSPADFNKAVGKDFIKHANRVLDKGHIFLVGLSHGRSPSGAYQYILEHYKELKRPENILYTFVNSPMSRQRNLEGVLDASAFIRKLFRAGYINRDQIIGYSINRATIEEYAEDFNQQVETYLEKYEKDGFDYVFLATNPAGKVAAIERNSKAFDSDQIAVVVKSRREKEITGTPTFLLKSKRIAFLATKADKRRSLAWLYAHDASRYESPGFLRYMPEVNKRMTVFIDDHALTWPQIEVVRETPYGESVIRIDTANPYNEDASEKLPVIIFIHGFLGLNSFDGLLATLPSHKYIAAAMHYGSIPHDLPPEEYSHHVAANIDAVVGYFGTKGHEVYIFDHSMGNIYMMMIDRDIASYQNVKKYLKGRIGANPFFGEEAKHAILGFLDNVIIPALSITKGPAAKTLLITLRTFIPLDSKSGVRKRGIQLSDWLIRKDSLLRDRIWSAAKQRIQYLMSNMDSLPHLNRIPIEKALNRLPAKIFAIQTHSALEQSIAFDTQEGLIGMPKCKIPVLILKSEKDGVAKYVDRIYQGKHIQVQDVTNPGEEDLFREHLFHMAHPKYAASIIDDFVSRVSEVLKEKYA